MRLMDSTTLLLLLGLAACAANASDEISPKILGGVVAEIGDAAYSVSLQNENGHFCGGVIVNKNTVLTSAVCAKLLEPSKSTIKAGATELTKATEFKVTKVEIHPDFDNKDKLPINDLAAFKVAPEFNFTGGNLKAAVLPTQGQRSVQGESVIVAGWGSPKVGEKPTDKLMKVKIRIVGEQDCNAAYKITIPEKQICAGEEGKDACVADGGSGLVLENMVLGLVSWGRGCGEKPGVYTELAPFRAWIDDQMA